MTIKEKTQFIRHSLQALYHENEVETFVWLIFEHLLQYSKIEIHFRQNEILEADIDKKINDVISDLQKFKPIQYIFGECEFYNLKLKVDENVLIPRQETEELVRKIIDENKSNSPTILDIGTGSGCIAISLAKNIKNSKVYALDISTNALNISKQNAEINNVTINFINESIFEIQEIENTKFDVIVSNPPYVTENEKQEISANVLDFEPHLALFVENEKPLIFYDKICDFAIKNLNQNGKLYFEINQYFGNEMKDLMQSKGFKNVEIIKDLNGNDRIAFGSL